MIESSHSDRTAAKAFAKIVADRSVLAGVTEQLTPDDIGCAATMDLRRWLAARAQGKSQAIRIDPPTLVRRLPDGTLGYFVRLPRKDDCFAAAIATVLQVPIDDVPDPRIDDRLAGGERPDDIGRAATLDLRRWLATRNLRMVVHRHVPVARRRWIGIVVMPGNFNDHCLVMNHTHLLFDPAAACDFLDLEQSKRRRVWKPDDISFGLSFRQIQKPRR